MRHYTTHLICSTLCALLLCFLTATTAAAVVPDELADRDITLAVNSELIVSDAVPFHKIDVSTENGIVTLSGSVDSFYAKLRAKELAESVKGVIYVINNIDVRPFSRLDSQIRGDVISALAADPVTEAYEIGVSVAKGVVTLHGRVDSYTEKSVAEKVAEDVIGVKDINNELTYDVTSDRTDTDIKADVEYRLKSDAMVDAGLIGVTVDDGEVKLDGTVKSAIEKSEATTEAWMVPGVEGVTNDIKVEWWAAGTSDWDGGWTDKDMKSAIDNALLTNPRVASYKIGTTVSGGVATLTGTVGNLQAKRIAQEAARDILGVWRVKNYLRVRPPIQRTDTQIAQEIGDALQRSPYVQRYDIVVTVHNGQALLGGQVDSWFQRNKAEETAAGVLGVVDVQNNLDVDQEFTAKSDQEIKDDIESQLFWSPFVDSDDITVEVYNGVATLMGTVEDYGELKAAKENAREGGATAVVSKLDMENGSGAG